MADTADGPTGARRATGGDAFGITDCEADLLLDLAEAAIRAGLDGRDEPDVDAEHLPPALHQQLGAFVTLHVSGELNGCIGNIDGTQAIALDVAHLAVRAAFHDPRLPELRDVDLSTLEIEVSLLSTPIGVAAATRTELLRHLRPHEHGLIVERSGRRGVFLPVVWQQLPEPDDFVDQLLRKAGLPHEPWPGGLIASVFTTSTANRRLDDRPVI